MSITQQVQTANESFTIIENYKSDEITMQEREMIKRNRIKNKQDMYWFRGIKMHINVISNITNKSIKTIKQNSKKLNLSIQNYLKTLENKTFKYKPDKTYELYREKQLIEFTLNGYPLYKLSKVYNVKQVTLYNRYYKGYRTYDQLILGKNLRKNGERYFEHRHKDKTTSNS